MQWTTFGEKRYKSIYFRIVNFIYHDIACVKYFSGIIIKYFLALCNERHLVRNATKRYICNLFYFSSIQFYSTSMGIIMQLCENSLQHSFYVLPLLKLPTFNKLARLGCVRMVVAFTTTCAISDYHHYWWVFEHCSRRDILGNTLCDKGCQ